MLVILLIEDSDEDAELMQSAVRRENIQCSIRRVVDGRHAIRYLEGSGEFTDRILFPFPDVIVTDLKMPFMDGFEVIHWVKSHPQCSILPVTVFSTSSQDSDVQKAYRLGANAYVVKPNTFTALQKSVREVHDFWTRCAKPHI